MPLTTDIEIDGAGYMVASGTYKRMQDGMAEGRTGRIVVRDFFGGQRRAYQLERDRSWDSVGVGPAYFGQGVEPWPNEVVFTDGIIATVTSAVRAPSIVVGEYAYVGVGRYLFRSVSLGTATWASFTQVVDFGAGRTITALANYQGNVAVCLGDGLDVRVYSTGSGAVSTLTAGEKGQHAVGYAGRVVYSEASPDGATDKLKMTTGGGIDERDLDSQIVNMGLFGGKVAIATRTSIWLLGGKSDPAAGEWLTDPEPFFTHGVWAGADDFAFLLGFGGRLYTWLNNQVMEWNPHGDRSGWRAIGVEGQRCFGATVAGNMLVVTITTRLGDTETWAFDGSGWWLVHRAALGTGSTRVWPMHTGGAGNRDLLLFRDGHNEVAYDLYRMVWRSESLHTYKGSAGFRTSLLDCGERDKDKAWRKIGATFAAPEARGNAGSTDNVVLTLSYSLDGGKTFTEAATKTVNDPTAPITELDADIASNAAVSRWLQLRLAWTSVADWAPVLTGLWAEYELLDSPARRRKWAFKVHARDAVVHRDGGVSARTGRELAADLWADWRNGATVPFKDLDHDSTAETYQVRIIGISEEVPKPADGGRFGESVVALTLVEV